VALAAAHAATRTAEDTDAQALLDALARRVTVEGLRQLLDRCGDALVRADAFWKGTRDHDVTENYEALLRNLDGPGPFTILDLGCGPGRDLAHFRSLGHEAVGLEGAARFVEMARRHSGCEVLHQDFLRLSLPAARFDGVFANASLFHIPGTELPRVLRGDHVQPRRSLRLSLKYSLPVTWSCERYCLRSWSCS
jgi:SAM-dependent methyltransferase